MLLPRPAFQPFILNSEVCCSVGCLVPIHCSSSNFLYTQNQNLTWDLILQTFKNYYSKFSTYFKKSSISGILISMYKKAALYSCVERSHILLGQKHLPGCWNISISQQGRNVEAPSSYLGALFLAEWTFDLKKRKTEFVASSTSWASTMQPSTLALLRTFFLSFCIALRKYIRLSKYYH